MHTVEGSGGETKTKTKQGDSYLTSQADGSLSKPRAKQPETRKGIYLSSGGCIDPLPTLIFLRDLREKKVGKLIQVTLDGCTCLSIPIFSGKFNRFV